LGQDRIAMRQVTVHTVTLTSRIGATMETCFVIQPFDAGRYDKLYTDVYAPAIQAAGYTSYRVDQDPSVSVPIDSIEAGIKSAVVCLADITEDNPNVWYELGFAFAANRPVVMICAENRQGRKFPFDIQHRSIILYRPDSLSDFQKLKQTITTRMMAIVKRDEALQLMSDSEPVKPVAGLSSAEIMLVALLAGGLTHNSTMSAWSIKQDAERVGLTGVGVNLAIRRLLAKEFIEEKIEHDEHNGEEYTVYRLLDRAWGWIEENEERIVIHRSSKQE
jgi:hypothetical protein